jgi:hypothetical protein
MLNESELISNFVDAERTLMAERVNLLHSLHELDKDEKRLLLQLLENNIEAAQRVKNTKMCVVSQLAHNKIVEDEYELVDDEDDEECECDECEEEEEEYDEEELQEAQSAICKTIITKASDPKYTEETVTLDKEDIGLLHEMDKLVGIDVKQVIKQYIQCDLEQYSRMEAMQTLEN